MAFEQNKTLFGHDPEERIIAVALEESGDVRLYSRDEKGALTSRTEKFRPFLWADSEIADERLETHGLTGELVFGYLAECEDWGHFTKLRLGLKNTGIQHFSLNDPVQQYLMRSGKTLFKGMESSDLHRLQFAVDGDAIAMSDNRGWSEQASGVAEMDAAIRARDPDVIEGHDLFRKILPAVSARAKNGKVRLAWGRDGSSLTNRTSRIQVAEKTINYRKFEATGRHLVDTFLLAQFWDVGARELEGYELEDVAAHFHIAGGDPASRTRELATLLGASYFVQAKIFPFNYQDVVVRGNAVKIDALLLREYLRKGHSIPDLPETRPFAGGYTDIFFTGIAKNVEHCDVASLYPSVMLQFDCFPVADQLGIFRHLLSDLRQFRLEAKAKMRAAPADERAGLNALQSTFKILINSFYGYLGFAQAHFADFDAASRVTEIGRDLLKKMVQWLQEQGAQVIEIDTDGIYFVPPSGKEPSKLQAGLMEILPKGIEVEFDAHYKAMFSYKAKNYALLDSDGELTITGGALKSRGLEKFQRVFLEEMIKFLMAGDQDAITRLHADYERKIRNREWPVEFFMKTDTLQDSLAQYKKKIEGSSRNRAAAYELAVKSGRHYQPGDQVSYYITGLKKNVSAYENSKLATEWDPKARDENVEYYIAKLNDLLKKFADFVQPQQTDSGQMQLI
ncbi:MAG TPA: DNA polymerase domain-containing protein [Chthoniobacteraceae bacterium]|nr:DNA polymerase domain-containing protein [Chthoniobacteraceae bacterium]